MVECVKCFRQVEVNIYWSFTTIIIESELFDQLTQRLLNQSSFLAFIK